jgi:hypothetical protein
MPRCLGAGSWSSVAPRPSLPDHVQCPAILSRYSWIGSAAERAVECCTGHRQDSIVRHVFRSCESENGSKAAAPSITDVLAALRGRTVVFLGDSTMHQLWTALVAEIFASGQPIDVTQRVLEFDLRPQNHNRDGMCTVSHTNQARLGGCENTFRLHSRSWPTCNHTGYQGGRGADGVWQLRPQCLSIPDLELSLPDVGVHFKFFRVDNNKSKTVRAAWQRTHSHCQTAKKNFDDKLTAATATADALIANIGVWYGEDERPQYRADVDHILSRLQALPGWKLGLYRESIVQHFPTQSGSGLYEERSDTSRPRGRRLAGRGRLAGLGKHLGKAFGGGRPRCQPRCADLGATFAKTLDWRNAVLHELVTQRGFPAANVVPVASLLRPMAAVHKSTKWACTLDCTHYCYHPNLWAALLDGVYRRLINWADEARPMDSGARQHEHRATRRGTTAVSSSWGGTKQRRTRRGEATG